MVLSSTVMSMDRLHDTARDMAECLVVAIIEHKPNVLAATHHVLEDDLAYFTGHVYQFISFTWRSPHSRARRGPAEVCRAGGRVHPPCEQRQEDLV